MRTRFRWAALLLSSVAATAAAQTPGPLPSRPPHAPRRARRSRPGLHPAHLHRAGLEQRLLGRGIPVGQGQLVRGPPVLTRFPAFSRVPVPVVEGQEDDAADPSEPDGRGKPGGKSTVWVSDIARRLGLPSWSEQYDEEIKAMDREGVANGNGRR